MAADPPPTTFRARVKAGDLLVGTFVKTPTGHATEILGDLGFDFVVIDEEHAPFDRVATDSALLAARAAGCAALVRVQSPSPWHMLSVLDSGATGVLVPHVTTVTQARDIALACRYRGGKRGFSASTRAGRYGGMSRWELVDSADAATTVVAQIEDPEALDQVEEIAKVDGIDALFIGRGDLVVAMNAANNDTAEIRAASERIAKAARGAGKAVAIFAGSVAEVKNLREIGASVIVYSSDQGFMRSAAARARDEIRALV
jgi:staphyloferrin B biosynthesis citrate synthase